ncbi:hypothetical protein LX90_009281, partial [Lentzea flava]|nr:hypothetical protein [Lentzea flava]
MEHDRFAHEIEQQRRMVDDLRVRYDIAFGDAASSLGTDDELQARDDLRQRRADYMAAWRKLRDLTDRRQSLSTRVLDEDQATKHEVERIPEVADTIRPAAQAAHDDPPSVGLAKITDEHDPGADGDVPARPQRDQGEVEQDSSRVAPADHERPDSRADGEAIDPKEPRGPGHPGSAPPVTGFGTDTWSDGESDSGSVVGVGHAPTIAVPTRAATRTMLSKPHVFDVDLDGSRLVGPGTEADLVLLGAALRTAARMHADAELPPPQIVVSGPDTQAEYISTRLRDEISTNSAHDAPIISTVVAVEGPVRVDVTVDLRPPGTEHGPTAHTAGGVSFDSGDTSEKAHWDRLHSAHGASGGIMPFYVYATARGDKFLVDGELVDGATLAKYVRSSPAYRKYGYLKYGITSVPVPVRLVAADPANPEASRRAAKEFAKALRGERQFFAVFAASDLLEIDANGETVVANGGTFAFVADVRPDDVEWRLLVRPGGKPFGMGFDTPENRELQRHVLNRVNEHTMRTVVEKSVDSSGEARYEYKMLPWAAATTGNRTEPLWLFPDSLVPLPDGQAYPFPPEQTAALYAASSTFQALINGAVRPPLILVTRNPRQPAGAKGEFNARFLAKLEELVGPLHTFSLEGRAEFNTGAVLEVDQGSTFVESAPPDLADVVHVSAGSVFAFPAPGESVDAVAVAELARAVRDGSSGFPTDSVVVYVGSVVHGEFARISLKRGGVLEFDGGRLARMLLEVARGRPIVLLGKDSGVRINFGALGFDFAGVFRAAGDYNDVYALKGEPHIGRDGVELSDGAELVLVSTLRGGDLRTEVLSNRHGFPVALYLRSPGDSAQYAKARDWAWSFTPSVAGSYFLDQGGGPRKVPSPWASGMPLFVVLTPGTGGYQTQRKDGVSELVSLWQAGQVLRSDPEVRQLLGGVGSPHRDRQIVPMTLDGTIVDPAEFAQSMLPGGYSRWIHTPAGVVTLSPDGFIIVTGGGFLSQEPLRPGPEGVISYAMENETLGVHGVFFPLTAEDAIVMSQAARADMAVTQQWYVRIVTTTDSNGQRVTRYVPYVAPFAGTSITPWGVDGHGSESGFWFAMRTDRPMVYGDDVEIDGWLSADVVAGTRAYLEAHPHPEAPVAIGLCLVQATSGMADSPAEEFWDRWEQLMRTEVRVFAPTDEFDVNPMTASRAVNNGGWITEASPNPGVPRVPLADLATSHIDPIRAEFRPRTHVLANGSKELLRDRACKAARAWAWRAMNAAPLPKFRIILYQDGPPSTLRSARLMEAARRDTIERTLLDEVAEEAARLSGLGFDVPSDQISLSFEVRPVQSGRDPGWAVEVVLPVHELGQAALALIESKQSDATPFINEAFAALARRRIAALNSSRALPPATGTSSVPSSEAATADDAAPARNDQPDVEGADAPEALDAKGSSHRTSAPHPNLADFYRAEPEQAPLFEADSDDDDEAAANQADSVVDGSTGSADDTAVTEHAPSPLPGLMSSPRIDQADLVMTSSPGVVRHELEAVALVPVPVDRIEQWDPAWRTSSEPLYRFAYSGPEGRVYREGGFRPLDPYNYDLMTRTVADSPSAYVSLTRDAQLHRNPLTEGAYNGRFRWWIEAPGGIVVNDTMLAHDSRYEHEQEVIFAGGVSLRFIRGVHEITADGEIGRFFPNPYFRPEIEPPQSPDADEEAAEGAGDEFAVFTDDAESSLAESSLAELDLSGLEEDSDSDDSWIGAVGRDSPPVRLNLADLRRRITSDV